MSWLTTIPDYIGAAIYFFGIIMIIACAFEKSTGTGILMLLFGGVIWPIYVITNWKQTSFWFYHCLVGALIVYIF